MEISSSFNPLDIAISGLRAQNKNMEMISSNVANAQSTDDGSGQPYRKLDAIFKADGDENGIGGVNFEGTTKDMSDFQRLLKPGHPDADEQGYVAMSNVQVPIEMMNLNAAARSYQANVAILRRYQNMVETTLELLK